MDQTELSLGLSSEFDGDRTRRKRKQIWDEPWRQSSIELHIKHPLPLDWEQCLDLQSGKMYYLNRRTLKKSWMGPAEVRDQLELDLNLKVPTLSSSEDGKSCSEQLKKQDNSGGGMVAVVCVNCHLLVMLSKLSPSCPNCKYEHTPLPSLQPSPPPPKLEAVAVKSLKTLSLLH